MRLAAQSGASKGSDANASWGRILVCGPPVASCGAPASQTHIGTVAKQRTQVLLQEHGREGECHNN
jgi:hypothetical protein